MCQNAKELIWLLFFCEGSVVFDQALSTFLYAFASFIPVLNPFGGALFFLALTPNIDDETRKMMVNRIVLYSGIILLICLFAGHLILSFFGISMGVLRVAGGLVLISTGWKALNEATHDDSDSGNIEPPKSRKKLLSMAFYPITLPLTMGPGMIAVSTAIGTGVIGHGMADLIGCLVAVVATLMTIYVCYRYCDRVSVAVGATGADALSRVFAFILLCIGVAIFWQGFTELWLAMPKS